MIFDRDSTLIEDLGYTHKQEDLSFLPGALEAIAFAGKIGAAVAIATNQSGVGRGLFTLNQLDNFHHNLVNQICQATGMALSVIASCIHLPHDDCACRKPKPGLLLAILELTQVPRRNAIFLGNATSDLEAGVAAGVSARISSGDSLYQHIIDWDKKS